MSRTHLLSLSLLLTVAALSAGCDDQATTEEVEAAPKDVSKKEIDAKKTDDGPPAGWEEAPADVAAPPADATKTASGLAWKLLKKGSGTGRSGLSFWSTLNLYSLMPSRMPRKAE